MALALERSSMTTHHDALIYTMVLVSAADNNMPDAELLSMGDAVLHLPVFRDFDRQKLPQVTGACAKLLQDTDGLDRAFKVIKSALPEKLRETAYALACDVAAADGKVTPEESRILELIRHHLQIGRLPAAAIERGSRARHTHL
jgi:tellurite resistance protein